MCWHTARMCEVVVATSTVWNMSRCDGESGNGNRPKTNRPTHLGYSDPGTINPHKWVDHETKAFCVLPKAGEMLYRVKSNDNRLRHHGRVRLRQNDGWQGFGGGFELPFTMGMTSIRPKTWPRWPAVHPQRRRPRPPAGDVCCAAGIPFGPQRSGLCWPVPPSNAPIGMCYASIRACTVRLLAG